MQNEETKQIRALLRNARYEQAIKELNTLIENRKLPGVQPDLYLLEVRYNRYNRDIQGGLREPGEEFNKITQSLFAIISEVEQLILEQKTDLRKSLQQQAEKGLVTIRHSFEKWENLHKWILPEVISIIQNISYEDGNVGIFPELNLIYFSITLNVIPTTQSPYFIVDGDKHYWFDGELSLNKYLISSFYLIGQFVWQIPMLREPMDENYLESGFLWSVAETENGNHIYRYYMDFYTVGVFPPSDRFF